MQWWMFLIAYVVVGVGVTRHYTTAWMVEAKVSGERIPNIEIVMPAVVAGLIWLPALLCLMFYRILWPTTLPKLVEKKAAPLIAEKKMKEELAREEKRLRAIAQAENLPLVGEVVGKHTCNKYCTSEYCVN
jgi:hypothetical protein